MNEKLKTIKIIHIAICAGVILFYFVLGNFETLEFLKMPTVDNSSIIFLLLPIAAYVLSSFLYKFQIKNVDSKLSLEEKIPAYQTASIMRWAIIEGAAIVILFIKPEFAILGILLIAYLIYLRPSENEFKTDFDTRL